MDGYTATREIRAREHGGRHLPIVAMTAHALGGEREKCLAAGMDDYLAKPVRIADLEQKIDYWCTPTDAEVPAGAEGEVTEPAEPAPAAAAHTPQPVSPSAVATEYAAALDPKTLDELREVMGDDLLELIDAYLSDTQRRLQELDQAVGDAPEVLVTVAHTLKGSSANVGATAFAARCATVHRRAAANGHDPELPALVRELGGEFERVRCALQDYRAALVPG